MSIERTRVTGPHPLDAIVPQATSVQARRIQSAPAAAAPPIEVEAAEPSSVAPAKKTTRSKAKVKPSVPSSSAESVQLNVRVPKALREQVATAVPHLMILEGTKIDQNEIVRRGVAKYLQELYDTHNNGKPFGHKSD